MFVQTTSKKKFDRMIGEHMRKIELDVPSYFRVRALDIDPVFGYSYHTHRWFELGGRYYVVTNTDSCMPARLAPDAIETPWNSVCNSHAYEAMHFELLQRKALGLEFPKTWRELYGYHLQLNSSNVREACQPFWDFVLSNDLYESFSAFSEECRDLFLHYTDSFKVIN